MRKIKQELSKEKSGNFCFHGVRSGHKIGAIEKCDKVSICVLQDEGKNEGEWFNRIKSVKES